MWQSLLLDLAGCFDVVTTVDGRWRHLATPGEAIGLAQTDVSMSVVTSARDRDARWMEHARNSEIILLIAPESDAIQRKLADMFRATETLVWAPQPRWLATFADKRSTEQWLHENHVPTIGYPGCPTEGWIVKPLDGCGSDRVRWYASESSARASCNEHLLCQPHHLGTPASVLVATSVRGRRTVLPAVGQCIERVVTNGSMDLSADLRYAGGYGPLASDAQRRASELVDRCLASLPPLETQGFLGFDLILGKDPSTDVVVEVNPRLTTSYVGYRQMLDVDLETMVFGPPEDHNVALAAKASAGRSVRWSSDGSAVRDG